MEGYKKFKLIILGIIIVIGIMIVSSYKVGYGAGEKTVQVCISCEECPYTYFNHEINKSDKFESAYYSYDSINFNFYESDYYRSIEYSNYKSDNSVDMSFNLRTNYSVITITDLDCVDRKYGWGSEPKTNESCSIDYIGYINKTREW